MRTLRCSTVYAVYSSCVVFFYSLFFFFFRLLPCPAVTPQSLSPPYLNSLFLPVPLLLSLLSLLHTCTSLTRISLPHIALFYLLRGFIRDIDGLLSDALSRSHTSTGEAHSSSLPYSPFFLFLLSSLSFSSVVSPAFPNYLLLFPLPLLSSTLLSLLHRV
jgi:hypothetical protein